MSCQKKGGITGHVDIHRAVMSAATRSSRRHKAAIEAIAANGNKVRIADIGAFRSEGPLLPLFGEYHTQPPIRDRSL